MCVVFMHTRTCQSVCACVHIAVGMFTLSWGRQHSPGPCRDRDPQAPIQTHTHRNTPHGLRRHGQGTAPQNVAAMDIRLAVA